MSDDESYSSDESYDRSDEEYEEYVEIFEAIRNNEYKLLKTLLKRYDIKYWYCIMKSIAENMLFYALNRNKIKIFKYLMKHMDINHHYIANGGKTILSQICDNMNNSFDCAFSIDNLERILMYNPDINSADIEGNTALMFAINNAPYDDRCLTGDGNRENFEKYIKVIKLLLEHGADPLKYNKFKYDAIYYAGRRRNINILELLLPYINGYVNINILFNLMLSLDAHLYDISYDIIEMLLPYIKDINEKQEDKTVLYLAKRATNPDKNDIITLLESNGAI